MLHQVRVCAMLLTGIVAVSAGALAQQLDGANAPDLPWLARWLMHEVASLTDYRARDEPPPIFEVSQAVLEAKVCEQPCNVSAAYIPREGIYLAAHLDPLREPLDRAALLHELVHYLQQGHAKFAALSGCERERAKELEAYAIQN